MGTMKRAGFTVIEVMLFLAVTGLLAASILVGSGIAINQQRYRDSVSSLQSYIQQQYSMVTSVANGRDQNWTCDSSGNVIAAPDVSAGQPRGTTNCVILGRFITVDATGTNLTASNVVGYELPNTTTQASDIAEIANNYKLGISPIDQDTQVVSWGAQVVKPKTTTPQPLSILIVRSPLSGSIVTFTQDGMQTNPGSMIVAALTNVQRDLCVNAVPGTFVGKRMEVRVIPYATSQSAILVPTETDSVCD
jgi:type II secretory pathway pseudopilin PulG